MRYQKPVGVVLLLFALAALAVAGLQYWQGRQTFKLTVLSEMPITGINPLPVAGLGDAPRITVPETPPAGRTLHVASGATAGGDGSWEHPWKDLQESLCRLEPGDRLLVLAGGYPGPLSVGEECQDGTPEKPIEVYLSDDAVLSGRATEGPGDGAVLTLARSWWRLGGAEIRPLGFKVGIRIGPDVEGVTVDAVHIYSGVGSGIAIEPGSVEITISRNHLHRLGSPEGRGGGSELADGIGIRIAPGTRAITVADTKIHNIFGDPVRVLAPADYGDPTLAPAANLSIDDELFQQDQAKWW